MNEPSTVERPDGKVITFYSYKGGTGRSMALANVAWVLAYAGKKVLIIDWDLEAPGIHRYFRPFLIDKDLSATDGLIDICVDYSETASEPRDDAGEPADGSDDVKLPWYHHFADFERHAISVDFDEFPSGGGIDLLPAGRQSEIYATRVNSFNWSTFYHERNGGAFLDYARRIVKKRYDYVLIDSRTGVSDTSGICTVQMADVLVACFTYNNQGVDGASAVASSALKMKRDGEIGAGGDAFKVFAVPMRVESGELDKLTRRRAYAQNRFRPLMAHLGQRDFERYWQSAEVPHVPLFGFEETLAALKEQRFGGSTLEAYVRCAETISGLDLGALTFEISKASRTAAVRGFENRDAAAGTPDALVESESLGNEAESAFVSLPRGDRQLASELLLQFVWLGQAGESPEVKAQRVLFSELEASDQGLVETFIALKFVADVPGTRVREVELVDALLSEWPRLKELVSSNREFLLWRQTFRESAFSWASGQRSNALLSGRDLEEATGWISRRPNAFLKSDRAFVESSLKLRTAATRAGGLASAPTRGVRVFVVRPFGEKEGIDFDRVERELIQPALHRLSEAGISVSMGTSVEMARAGNIREDMFRLLVVADLVIADVSIHNANVFYQLGIRHALRPSHTLLLRGNNPGHKYPFDLPTDRYLLYDAANPGGTTGVAVEELVDLLRTTLASESPSSPVFQLLPTLRPQDRQTLVRAPMSFAEEVERARRDQQRGDLWLYADEVATFDWDQEGLRLVGEAQFRLRDYSGARETLENLRRRVPNDARANQRLATIYQRLALAAPPAEREALLGQSDQAIDRALQQTASPAERTSVLTLKASNAKSRWVDDIRRALAADRNGRALSSPLLNQMLGLYLGAVAADLNAYFPAVNALGLLQVQLTLAKALPDEWAQLFDSDEQATAAIASKEALTARLASMLTLSLRVDDTIRTIDDPSPDPWLAESRAAFLLLTLAGRPQRVAHAYRNALADADWFALDAVLRNLDAYKELGLFEANVSAALSVVHDVASALQPPAAAPDRVLLFTGHMVDAPDREKGRMRFPPTTQAEAMARALIEEAVKAELAEGGRVVGIAGGACGSDILFHEVCKALGVETRLFLALPRAKFQVAAVQRGGPRWIERYEALCDRVPPRVLQESESLPFWLAEKPGYDIWQRTNQWMMFNAIATAAPRLALIALYNQHQDADGPGGTSHLIGLARRWGFKSVELDARQLLPS
jgi:hypothetical protein